ncbi:hypothetical protein QTV49_001763 [Vibrio vulnificus]|nr:hypothetical protein [Vibrio vulnificus]
MSILDETSITIESIFNVDALKFGLNPPRSLKLLLAEQAEITCEAFGLDMSDSDMFENDADLMELIAETDSTGYVIEANMPFAKGFEYQDGKIIGYHHDHSRLDVMLFTGSTIEECISKAVSWHNENIANWSSNNLVK